MRLQVAMIEFEENLQEGTACEKKANGLCLFFSSFMVTLPYKAI